MVRILSTFFCIFLSLTISAQIEVTGQVFDNTSKQPLEFSTVVLIAQGDSSNIIGVNTDAEGFFKIIASEGNYRLEISYVGTSTYTTNLVLTNENVDLGILTITNTHQLDGVTVEAQRKLIQRKIDRLVFNVEFSKNASEGNALDVLRITPGVQVRGDEISMMGKNSVAVMINDKIVELSNEDLANILKSIASEDIKSIEVITTPPAKYEASGNSGLINIILKDARKDSWNAQMKTSYNQRVYPSGSIGGNFNFNKNKLSLASSINYRNGSYYQEQDDYAYFPNGLWHTYSPFRYDFAGMNARFDLNYQANSKWSIGAQYLFNQNDGKLSDTPSTLVFDNDTGAEIQSLRAAGSIKFDPIIHSFNVSNDYIIDTLGKTVSLNLGYFTYNNPNVIIYQGLSRIENPISEQHFRGINTNDQDVSNLSAKIDVELPTEWLNMSFGGKLSQSISLNDISFFNSGLVDEPITALPLSINDFEYVERIQAMYVSIEKELNEKWSTQLGLRMENTQTESISENLNISEKSDYLNFFPTAYLSYQASEQSNYSLNYSRRIERPQFYELNPNIYFINPFQTIEGNAFLQPAYIDNVELTSTYKNWVTSIYFSDEKEMFSQLPVPDSTTNIIRFVNKNFIDTKRFGVSENFTFDQLNWWRSSNSFNINYSISTFNLSPKHKDQKGINATISTYNNFTLNKAKTFSLGVNYWYSFPSVTGIFETKALSSLSLSLQYLLLDKKLAISLRGTDIFKTQADRTTTTVNGIFQEARYYYDSRSVRLSISYKFGNKDIQAKKHQAGNSEERGRTGN